MSETTRARIRAAVSTVVAALVAWLGARGVILPEDASAGLIAFVAGVAGVAYDVAAAWLEKHVGWLSRLLLVKADPEA